MRKTNKLYILLAAALAMAAGGCVIKVPKGKPIPIEGAGSAPRRTPIYNYAGWTIARGSIHNHTIYSDGKHTPEDLVELARIEGIAVLAITDHREDKLCIGKGFCAKAGGVERIGYAAYWDRMAQVQKIAEKDGMILTRGVEVSSPAMYNYGKAPNFLIYGQNNHFTVYGVKDPTILENMPTKNVMSRKPEKFAGDQAYQDFVDYLHDHGALVDVVHPESKQDDWYGGIHVLTPAPVWNLHLKHVTAFSILPEGWHEKTGAPGGLWDTALLEYMAGMRDMPLWASADADYHQPPSSLCAATTLFYMREFTEDEVFNCMREGRMVALQGDAFQNTYVSEWSVSGGSPPHPVMLGETAHMHGTPTVRFALDHEIPGCKIRLIRNGVVMKEADGSALTYKDDDLGARKEPAYYRIEVMGPRVPGHKYEDYVDPVSELFVNPIFVRFD